MMEFPLSGVTTYWWLPPLVAFFISACTASGGLSGAIILLPFQVSFLGFTGPAVSSTNLVYNIIATPGGVFRFYKEGRMVRALAWATILGTLPGVVIGACIRVYWLPDPNTFKPFAGIVLLYIAIRLLIDIKKNEHTQNQVVGEVTNQHFSFQHISFNFNGSSYRAPTPGILLLSFLVGIIGGTYGIGGGAIIAPFFVTLFGLPIYAVAGAALLGTFATSVIGVLIYAMIPSLTGNMLLHASPDWLLGTLFGIGGLLGTYVGARLQKHLPETAIKLLLAGILLGIGLLYLRPLFS